MYYGEVLCDVPSLDACHIFFGRSWLFDNHMMHDGHGNIYALKFEGPRLTLAPFPPPKLLKIKPVKGSEKNLYISETWAPLSKRKPLFALLMVESNTSEEVKSLHPLTQSLFREFEDVFPNDLRGSLL